MNTCVVGAGKWGKNHIRTLAELGVLKGVVESNSVVVKELKEIYPDVLFFSSLDEKGAMSFDAYTVVVPAEYHFEVAKQLIMKGKHVLVEKPITLSSKEARQLDQLAKVNHVILMTGHLLLFHSAFRKIKEIIESGRLGKLQYIYSNRLNLGTVRTEENSLWSFAPHDISLFQYLIGDVPIEVQSNGGAFLQPHIHDTTMTVLTYPNNVVGHIFVSWLHPFKEHRFVVIGSKGMVSYEDSSPNKELKFYEKGIDWVNGQPIKREGPTEVFSFESSAPLKDEMNHFIGAIKGDVENNLIDGSKGIEVLEVLEEAEICLNGKCEKASEASNSFHEKYFVHRTAVVDKTVLIGEGTKVWNVSNIQKNVRIGKQCILGQNVNVGSNVVIGNRCKIQNNVSVYEGVELEDYVFCGPSMVFTNIMMPRSKYPQASSEFYQKTLVKEGASIGANATILCGITLGQHSFIGAGAVVIKDVPDFAMMVGNPARQIGWVSEAGTILEFDNEGIAFCEKSEKTYRLDEDKVVEAELTVA